MQNRNLLAFLDEVYEDLELWYPKLRLEEAGYALQCAAPERKTYAGKHGYPAAADLLLRDARSEDYCGLLVPGGFMPDKLRRDAKVLSLTREFFATVQNKLHWAITGQTAAELIYTSADAKKIYMGLTAWKHAPRGKILKSDVTVAKNYLNEGAREGAESNRFGIPGSRRESRRAGHRDEYGGLAAVPERFSGIVELSDSPGQRQGERTGGEAQSGR